MLAAMAQPDEPKVPSRWPHPHPEPGKLAIPDSIFIGLQAQLAAGKIAVEKGPATGRFPVGDHMAIFISRTANRSPGNLRILGDQIAIGSSQTNRRFLQSPH